MKSLVNETYVCASVVAVGPALLWAIQSYGQRNFLTVVGTFVIDYIFFCQILIIPRYIFAAATVHWLGRLRLYSVKAGIFGFVIAGGIADTYLTYGIARGVAQPPAENWTVLLPLVFYPFALVGMISSAIILGFLWLLLRPDNEE